MSATTRQQLWAALGEAGLVEGGLPERGEARSPWFVRLMLGVAGWIGAIFLLAFVAVALSAVIKTATTAFFVGAVACGTAAVLLKANNDFVSQLGLAVSLAGQALMAYAISEWLEGSIAAIAFAIAAQQAVLFVLVPNFIHRVWTGWSAAYALGVAMTGAGLQALAPAAVTAAVVAVWLREFEQAKHGELRRAGGYGLALAAIQLTVIPATTWYRLMSRAHGEQADHAALTAAGAVALGAVLIAATVLLLRREGVAPQSARGRIALVVGAIIALASVKAPGVAPALAILMIGYANGNRVLTGLGIAALVVYLSYFYYALDSTLLEKSALLASTGIALLLMRLALHRGWPLNEETSHA